MAAKPYQGHPSYNHWNVSLWVSNEEWLYRLATSCKTGIAFYNALMDCGYTQTGDSVKISKATAIHAWKDAKGE